MASSGHRVSPSHSLSLPPSCCPSTSSSLSLSFSLSHTLSLSLSTLLSLSPSLSLSLSLSLDALWLSLSVCSLSYSFLPSFPQLAIWWMFTCCPALAMSQSPHGRLPTVLLISGGYTRTNLKVMKQKSKNIKIMLKLSRWNSMLKSFRWKDTEKETEGGGGVGLRWWQISFLAFCSLAWKEDLCGWPVILPERKQPRALSWQVFVIKYL